MKELNDIALIGRVTLLNDTQAFNKLVVKYQLPIRRFFLNQTQGNVQLSDDLAQDTFIKAYVNLNKFKALSCFSTWLYRIAYNVFYDYVRSNKFTQDIGMSVVSRCHSETAEAGLTFDIYTALKILSRAERTCIILQLIEGQSIDKIVDITGMASGTVKSHLSRGKEKLAHYLKQNGYDRKR